MMMWLIDVIVPGVGGVTGGVTAGGVVVGGGFPVVCVGALELAPHADIITTNKIAKVNWTTKKARARFDTTRPFRFLRVGSSSSLWGWQLCKLLHRHPGSSMPDPRETPGKRFHGNREITGKLPLRDLSGVGNGTQQHELRGLDAHGSQHHIVQLSHTTGRPACK